MIRKSTDFSIVSFSVKVYQALLVAYPAKFRQEYGMQLVQLFRDCCLRTVRQEGVNGMLKLWAITLFDVVQSALSEHAQKQVEMKKEMKPEDIRLAGWALIGGAAAFVIGLLALTGGEYALTAGESMDNAGVFALFALSAFFMVILTTPLLVIGLLALRNRYGGRVGRFGKNVLLVGAILGPLTNVIGLIGSFTHLFFTDDFNWILTYVGPAVLFAGLALFGLVASYKKPLPRWNAVVIIAGIWYPITTLSHTLVFLRTGGWVHAYPQFILVAFLDIIQGIALAALGYILKSDAPQPTVAMA